nr:AAA family ATPase [uncultured Methanobrevibacter sp.]
MIHHPNHFQTIQYFLQKGNTLIIEEPENHLHPENQRILVKYLVKLINNDLNIILTTHSDYILEQFNNLIRLGKVNKDKLNELGYSDENILNHEEVKIYNFKKESDYLYVPKEVDINETALLMKTFQKLQRNFIMNL